MNWLKKNRLEFLIIVLILLLAAFLRFYKLSEYMTFLGDEGRDVLIVKDLLQNGNVPFIGPPTSVGNIYLGPLYYYMMAVSMTVFWLNPVAPAGMVALIGFLTVGLIYYLSREWFGRKAAVISSFLYAVSFVTIIYSRSSWNPNPAPFFTLLTILGFHLAYKFRDFRWFILTGASIAATIQMHYLALILIPIVIIYWIYTYFSKNRFKYFWLGSIGALIIFLLVMSPLILFDLKHNFLNYHGILALFTQKNEAVEVNSLNRFRAISIYSDSLIGRYIAAENNLLTWLVSILVLIPLVNIFLKPQEESSKFPYLILGSWILIGLAFLSFYKGSVYDHYLGFLNPMPFILLGSWISIISLIKNDLIKKCLIGGFVILVLVIAYNNLQRNLLFTEPGNQLERTQKIAKFIISESGGKPFNFTLLSENNYDAAYQFYLDIYGHKPELAAVEREDQLFVVCEDKVCQPINNPKYEIASYGYAKIEWEKEVYGFRMFKLIPNPSGKP